MDKKNHKYAQGAIGAEFAFNAQLFDFALELGYKRIFTDMKNGYHYAIDSKNSYTKELHVGKDMFISNLKVIKTQLNDTLSFEAGLGFSKGREYQDVSADLRVGYRW